MNDAKFLRPITILLAMMFLVPALPFQPMVSGTTGSRNIIDFGPYLQNVSKTQITVRWYTSIAGSTEVDYGISASYVNTVTVPGSQNFHEVNITGLLPNQTYHYQVITDDAKSSDATFRTARNSTENFDFIAYGDTRTDHVAHSAIINRMNKFESEFTLNMGDLVDAGGTWSYWPPFFADIAPLANHSAYYTVIGNHDYPLTYYPSLFTLPNNEHWYSFDYANVHVIGLETNDVTYYQYGSAQQKWLRSDLIKATNDSAIDFIIVFFHNPPYSSGGHGSDMNVRNNLCPIFKEYGVDMVLSGHDHDYERYLPPDNVTYVVTGGGGAPLGTVQPTAPYRIKGLSAFHFLHIIVKGRLMNVTAYYTNGTAFDSWSFDKLDKVPPAKVPLTARDTGVGNSVDLDWAGYDEVKEGVRSYRVYVSEGPFQDTSSMAYLPELGAQNHSFRVTNLTDYKKYYFAVVAVDHSGNRDPLVSAIAATPTDKTPPLPPGRPTIEQVGYTFIRFNWTPSTSTDVAGYLVFRNATGAGSGGPYALARTVPKGTLECNMTGLSNGTGYHFVVRAFDDAIPPNNSTMSPEGFATTTIPNRAPRAISNGAIVMFEDQPLPGTINVSSLFWDPDGDALSFSAGFADPADRSNASFTLGKDDVLQVSVAHEWNGAFDILVNASDGALRGQSIVHVTVAAVNDAPVLALEPEYDVKEDASADIPLKATDIDGDSLVYSLKLPPDLASLPTGSISLDNVTGILHVGPLRGFVGVHPIFVMVSDGKATVSGTLLLNVKNVNDPPGLPQIISPSPGTIYYTDGPVALMANATDPDIQYGDKLTLRWYLDNGTTPVGEGMTQLSGLTAGMYNVKVVVSDLGNLKSEATTHFLVKVRPIPPVQTKTCPDGSVIMFNLTCPKQTVPPTVKHINGFLGLGQAADYAIIALIILLCVILVIAVVLYMRLKEERKVSKNGQQQSKRNGPPPTAMNEEE